jgi:3-oxoacyl-[acyl-carrier-protein] synthase II
MTDHGRKLPVVAVVDAGITCALGRTRPAVLSALKARKTGLAYEEIHGYPTAIGRVNSEISHEWDGGLRLDRGVALALDCVSQLQLLTPMDPQRCGVFWGVGIAGADWLESSYKLYCSEAGDAKTSPWTVPMIMPNAAASLIAMKLGLTGGAWTQASACASSAMAMGQAFHAIRSGALDMAVVGGSDAMLVPGMLHAWARMRVLARTKPELSASACKPFDAARNVLCLAEGAGCLVLMNAKLAQDLSLNPLAEIRGFGHSCDAYDLTVPSAEGQVQAMRKALNDAQIGSSQISYVCAHATGTRKGDVTELEAIELALGLHAHRCPISSVKSALGHTMGASGALASVITVGMLQSDWIAPTLHLTESDPFCKDWNLPTFEGVSDTGMTVAMVNAFGFGGSNASLIFKK